MKTILGIRTVTCVVLAVGALLSTLGAVASDSDSYPSYVPAKVIAHLPLSGGARQMFSQQGSFGTSGANVGQIAVVWSLTDPASYRLS
jgi:hypothetical protein